jgi:hypothetical protein
MKIDEHRFAIWVRRLEALSGRGRRVAPPRSRALETELAGAGAAAAWRVPAARGWLCCGPRVTD